jgi:predicted double-glycine peptidase
VNICGHWAARCLAFGTIGLSISCSAGGLGFNAGGLRLNAEVRSMLEIRENQVVRQRWDYSCGSAALSTVLTYHLNDPTPESAVVVSILRRTDPVRVRSRGGFSLLDLKHYLGRRGYASTGYAELDLDDLAEFTVPAIVPVSLKGYDHFVVFLGRYGDRVVLADPAFGNLTMSTSRFMELWKGGIGFVVKDVERLDSGASLDVAALPFTNLSVVHRLTSNTSFRRIRLP